MVRAWMCEFIARRELRRRFEAYGHFCRLRRLEEDDLRCRSTLEIVSNRLCTGTWDPSSGPSSQDRRLHNESRLLLQMGTPRLRRQPRCGRGYRDGREVEPGASLSGQGSIQTMRVMACVGFSHVRVLNLSDIRGSNSRTFLASLRGEAILATSILSSTRRDELKERARPLDPSIIAGWLQDSRSSPLAVACVRSLEAAGRSRFQCADPARWCPAGAARRPAHATFDYPAQRDASRARCSIGFGRPPGKPDRRGIGEVPSKAGAAMSERATRISGHGRRRAVVTRRNPESSPGDRGGGSLMHYMCMYVHSNRRVLI